MDVWSIGWIGELDRFGCWLDGMTESWGTAMCRAMRCENKIPWRLDSIKHFSLQIFIHPTKRLNKNQKSAQAKTSKNSVSVCDLSSFLLPQSKQSWSIVAPCTELSLRYFKIISLWGDTSGASFNVPFLNDVPWRNKPQPRWYHQ